MPFVRSTSCFFLFLILVFLVLLGFSYAGPAVIPGLYEDSVVFGELTVFDFVIFNECRTSSGGVISAILLIIVSIVLVKIIFLNEDRLRRFIGAEEQWKLTKKMWILGHVLWLVPSFLAIKPCSLAQMEYFFGIVPLSVCVTFLLFAIVYRKGLQEDFERYFKSQN